MDFLVTSPYMPMSRRHCVHESREKVLYEGPDSGTLIQHFRDHTCATEGKDAVSVEGGAVLINRVSEYIFTNLGILGIPTYFIRRLNMREQLVSKVDLVPLEVMVHNLASGSLLSRLGLKEGSSLPRPVVEFYYNGCKNESSLVSEEHIIAFGWANPQEIEDIMLLAGRVNDFLSGLFLGVGIRVVNFKIEFGRLWEDEVVRIVVADELSPKKCLLWNFKKPSSNNLATRTDLHSLEDIAETAVWVPVTYYEAACRLGIITADRN